MLFSVYPEAPLPKRGPNPFVIILAGCGGCALLVFLAVVGFGFFAYNKAKPMMEGILEQPKNIDMFLTNLQQHRYAEASDLIAPEAQKNLSAKALEQIEAKAEKKMGALQSWDKPSTQSRSRPGSDPQQSMTMVYPTRLHYAKGSMDAYFTFRWTDPFHPTKGITDFTLSTAQEGETSEQSTPEDTGKERGSGGKKRGDSEGTTP